MNSIIKILIAFTFVSCSFIDNKNSYINDYTDFIDDISLSGEDFTEKQWLEADSRYEIYSTDSYKKYKDELSSEERNRVNQLTGEYVALRALNLGKGIISDINDFGMQLEGMVETFKNEFQIDSIKE